MVETTVETKKELFTIEPWDEHNQKTVANVHPNDWVNPRPWPVGLDTSVPSSRLYGSAQVSNAPSACWPGCTKRCVHLVETLAVSRCSSVTASSK